MSTLLLVALGFPVRGADPPVLLQASQPGKAIVTLPGGELCILYMVSGSHCASIRSSDGGATWSEPRVEFEFRDPAGVPVVLVDREGELHAFMLVLRGAGRRSTVDYFYDIWHAATRDGRSRWSDPKRIFEGYVGALNGVLQLESGRIVLPQQFWVPGLRSEPPTGSHVVTTSYSDDGGRSWRLSPARLTSPCRSGYIGSNYGATEPVAVQLRDGRVWMLIRTQTGFLYESFSPDGVEWSEARPTRFRSSNSPANLLRLPDGRLVDHPTREGARVLQVRRPDERRGDEAVWNFPAAGRGRVSLRVLLPEGFGGGVIALADRFIQPTEPAAEQLEVFRLRLDADGKIEGGPVLAKGRWHALRLAWDLDRNRCSVAVDGQTELVLPRLNDSSDDLSYLRLRSSATSPDPAGMLIERVAAMKDE